MRKLGFCKHQDLNSEVEIGFNRVLEENNPHSQWREKRPRGDFEKKLFLVFNCMKDFKRGQHLL